jgi:hypothetical protein
VVATGKHGLPSVQNGLDCVFRVVAENAYFRQLAANQSAETEAGQNPFRQFEEE